MMLKFTKTAEEGPCRKACPARIDVPRYIRLIRQGNFSDALAVVREKVPFPSVCGRVCFRPCETICLARPVGGPIAINALKRFAAERGSSQALEESPAAKPSGKRVAVVGSGPAGLTASYYLALFGHGVTVFEASSEAGGMMRFGIPEYRLPKDVLNGEIDAVTKTGVEIRTRTRIGSLDDLFQSGYHAVFVALGTPHAASMGIEGEDDPSVVQAISFLKQARTNENTRLGDRVAVIGGGNSAIDGARTALRLGAKEVILVYRRSQDEMMANSAEVKEALLEGVETLFLTVPIKIKRENGNIKLECLHTRLGEVDESGRRRPEIIPGTEFCLDVDVVISAVGERAEVPDTFGLTTHGSTLKIDPETLATSREGIFAGGDAVTGPASVIEAIAMGRKAASAIDKYLGGDGVIVERLAPLEGTMSPLTPGLPVGFPVEISKLPSEERIKGFAEVEATYSEGSAVEEATRCLMCDLPIIVDGAKCTVCMVCQMICSFKFTGNSFNLSEAAIKLKRTEQGTCEIEFTEKCDHCGLCARYCSYEALSRGAP